jgi:hypothetical protein
MPKRQGIATPDLIDDIYTRLADVDNRLKKVKTPTWIERINPVQLPDPVEGQIAIDSRSDCLIYYANEAWREKCSAVHAIKIYGDKTANKVADGAFRFTIEDDLDGTTIEVVRAFNGTVGTGSTTLQVRNVTRAVNILNTSLSISSGAEHSGLGAINDGGDPDQPNNMVFLNDMMWINVLGVGSGSKGLGIYITFHGPKVDMTPV